MDHFLMIENLLVSKAYEEVLDYLDEIKLDNLYILGVSAYASYKLYHDHKYLENDNPYLAFLLEEAYPQVYEKLLQEKSMSAYQYLGLLTYQGLGVKADVTEARHWFSEAINLGSVPAKTYLAQTYLDQGDFKTGFRLLNDSQNFILSCFYLGNCYFNGYGVNEDKDRAERYYRQAMIHGFDEALYTLAMHYLASSSPSHSLKEAFKLLDQAALKGHERALLFLIQYFYKRDQDKYIDYLVQAATKGNKDVKYHIGYDYWLGINLPQDNDKAFYWLSLAAQEKHQLAINLLQEHFSSPRYTCK